jgi:hypothetical protein
MNADRGDEGDQYGGLSLTSKDHRHEGDIVWIRPKTLLITNRVASRRPPGATQQVVGRRVLEELEVE